MSERTRILISVTAVVLVLGIPGFCHLANMGVFGEVHFGYYGEFNVAKHAIEESGCVESLDYTRNEDTLLEEVAIDIHTRSGQSLTLIFAGTGMNMNQVCNAPEGISVGDPTDSEPSYQGYSMDALNELLEGQHIRISNLRDLLCNLDVVAPILKSNYGKETVPRLTYKQSRRNLIIAF
jgi:hypothetical protein